MIREALILAVSVPSGCGAVVVAQDARSKTDIANARRHFKPVFQFFNCGRRSGFIGKGIVVDREQNLDCGTYFRVGDLYGSAMQIGIALGD